MNELVLGVTGYRFNPTVTFTGFDYPASNTHRPGSLVNMSYNNYKRMSVDDNINGRERRPGGRLSSPPVQVYQRIPYRKTVRDTPYLREDPDLYE